MLTKGAIGNLVNRYKAVLAKCNLINTFGSLAVAAALVLGGAGVANAETIALEGDKNIDNSIGMVWDDIEKKVKTFNRDYLNCNLDGSTLTIKNTTNKIGAVVNNGTISYEYQSELISIGKDKTKGSVKIISNSSETALQVCKFAGEEQNSIKAKNIYIESANGFAIYIADGEGGSAAGNGISLEGETITIKSGGTAKNTIQVTPDSKLNISGKNVIIDSAKTALRGAGRTEINIEAVELNVSTSSTEKAAFESEADDNATFNVNEAKFNGDVKSKGQFNANGQFNLNGKNNTFKELANSKEGGNIEFVLANADTKVAIEENNADNLGVTGTAELTNEYGGDINKLAEQVDIEEGAKGTTLKLNESGIYGETTAKLGADNKVDQDTIKQKKNELMDAALQQASVTMVSLDKILTNDVRKRLGDIRSDKNTTGVWMRWDGGKLKGDSGLTNNFNTIQIGGDTKAAKNCRIGFAGSFTHGDTEFSRGNGELEGFSFALYGTWMGDNGMFADVVARLGKFSTEMNVDSMKGDMDNRVASLSAEYGWRLPICQQFFVEPQVELAYTYVSSDDLQLGDNHYEFDSVDSLTGRAGVVFGWNLPDERGNLYARASVVQQFMGDAKIAGSNGTAHNIQEIDGEDTWLEYGIGANVKLTDSTYLWADVERTEGADIEEEWRGTVGVRFSF